MSSTTLRLTTKEHETLKEARRVLEKLGKRTSAARDETPPTMQMTSDEWDRYCVASSVGQSVGMCLFRLDRILGNEDIAPES